MKMKIEDVTPPKCDDFSKLSDKEKEDLIIESLRNFNLATFKSFNLITDQQVAAYFNDFNLDQSKQKLRAMLNSAEIQDFFHFWNETVGLIINDGKQQAVPDGMVGLDVERDSSNLPTRVKVYFPLKNRVTETVDVNLLEINGERYKSANPQPSLAKNVATFFQNHPRIAVGLTTAAVLTTAYLTLNK